MERYNSTKKLPINHLKTESNVKFRKAQEAMDSGLQWFDFAHRLQQRDAEDPEMPKLAVGICSVV